MGWDIDRFPEGEVNLELICCICTCILEDPVESPCRHVFCSQCIKTWLSNQKSCPHCRAPVHKRDLQSVVPLLKNIISKQKIYCDNRDRGCTQIISLESLQGHTAICPYGLVTCTYEGCHMRVLRKDVKAHTEVCAKRTVMCEEGCEMFITLGEQDSHNCIQALRAHFQDVTNELFGRISKLEELVNDLVSKSNTNANRHVSHRHHRPHLHRSNRDNNETYDCVSYSIPSPRSIDGDRLPNPNDLNDTINVDNHEFSDSVESVESDSSLNNLINTYLNNHSPRPSHVNHDGDLSPTIGGGRPGNNNTFDGYRDVIDDQREGRRGSRRDSRQRRRSRSPHPRALLDTTYTTNNSLEERHRQSREQHPRESRGQDDTVVLRIGVSQTVSESSSSSSSSTDSDTD